MLRQSVPKILILESQLIIAADVSLQLSKLGYHIIGINICAEDAIKTIENNCPDIVLMNLKTQNTEERIKTASTILKTFRIPVIFLSAQTDRELFKQIMHAQPYAFITKPFEIKDLQRGLKTALYRMNAEGYWNENIRYAHENRSTMNRPVLSLNHSESDDYHLDSCSEFILIRH